MLRIAVNCILIALYFLTSAVSSLHFLDLLQQTGWQPRVYLSVLNRENMRWLPLIFSLVPMAAQLMDYGTLANVLTAAYLLAVIVYYLLRLRRRHGVWSGRVRRLHILWMLVWFLMLLPFLLLGTAQSDALVTALCVFFLLQAFVPPVLIQVDRPLLHLHGLRLIRGSEDILSRRRELKIIAVTGSADTEVLRTALLALLQTQYRCEMASRTVTTAVDAAQIIRDMEDPTLEYLIVRIDAGGAEEMASILDSLRPSITVQSSADYCVLVDEQPLARSQGVRFLNGDDEVLRQFIGTENVLTYGLRQDNDCRGIIERVDADGTAFTLQQSRFRSMELQTRLLGSDNLTSLVGAVSVAYALGVEEEKIRWQVRLLRPRPGRMEMTAVREVIRIDDSACEEAIEGEDALETLRGFEGLRILITNGFLRQGAIQEEANRRFGAAAADACDRIILVGPDVAYGLRAGILGAGFVPERLLDAPDLAAAWSLVDDMEAEGQKVVLAEYGEKEIEIE